ncbi:MAG: hypothetical protein ACRDQZ_13180 [Mycobacteriales bacterium]
MAQVPLLQRLRQRVDHTRRHVKLGRIYAPDPNDYHVKGIMPRGAIVVVSRSWGFGYKPHLDQGSVSACVGFSATNLILGSPVIGGVKKLGIETIGGKSPSDFALDVYHTAQTVDEFPGNSYEGTSVRAGQKVLQAQGRLKKYYFANSAAEARDFLIQFGPVIFGTTWYERMFTPDAHGYLIPEGDVAGGHAYLVLGFSKSRNAFRMMNQWWEPDPNTGKLVEWGEGNRAWLKFEHADILIQQNGECACPTELKLA